MSAIADNVTELIGNTPVLRLHKVVGDAKAEVLVKLEFFRPRRQRQGPHRRLR